MNNYEKFWNKVNIPNDCETNDQCWIWTGYCDKNGYGIFNEIRAHRFSYEMYFGQIPIGLLVLHKCDNPPCVNPNHLFLGTHKDNKIDCMGKERHAKGSLIGISKLTENQAKLILNKLISCEYKTYSDVIKDNPNITKRIIYNLLTKNCWTHITKEFDQQILNDIRQKLKINANNKIIRSGNNCNFSTINESIVKEILDKIENNTFISINQICNLFKISKEIVLQILNKKSWKQISQNYNLEDLKKKVLTNKKLSEYDVRNIKIRLSLGESAYSIAKNLNLGISNIYAIKNGKIWNNITI